MCALQEVSGGINLVNKQDFHFFLYGGAGMVFLAKNKKTDQKTYATYDIPVLKLTYLFNLSAGVSISNKFFGVVSYHPPAPVANFLNYAAMHSNLQVGVGYNLK